MGRQRTTAVSSVDESRIENKKKGGRRGISNLVEQGGGDEAAYTMEVAKIDFFNPVFFQDTCNTYFKVRRLSQCY